MSNFSLTPSLFIGIGSNGWRILDDLRKLMFEEFGQAGLPCFRYIGIETNAERKVDDSFLPHTPKDYEKVEPIHITIPDLRTVREHINPLLDQTYLPGLHEWLDQRLLNRGYQSFMAGAGGSRQAGRLCLWENWEAVKTTINNAFDEVKTTANLNATQAVLIESYFPTRNIEPPADSTHLISSTPKVYIVGTLCGGTCSGTFLDIAYFVSKLVGGQRGSNRMRMQGSAEVVGMFTIADTSSVEATIHSPAINCWAALQELDFYFRNDSRYSVELPDKTTSDTLDQPFDWVYLVSNQNMVSRGFTREPHPEGALTQMCAMNLFTEVVAGMAAIKDEKRIDLRQSCEGYLKPNQMGHIRAFSSFGLSAIWYPRFRIARAINRRLGKEVCSEWLKKEFNAARIRDESVKLWSILSSSLRGSLIGTIGGTPEEQALRQETNLKQGIEYLFETRQHELFEADEFYLSNYILNFPTANDTFVDRFSKPDGDYYRRIDALHSFVTKEYKSKLRMAIVSFLVEHTFTETKAYLGYLEQHATRDAAAIADEIPSFSQQMNLSLAHDVHNDLWTRVLFMQPKAVSEFKKSIWDDFKDSVIAHLENVRDHFLKGILASAQAYFGVLKSELSNAELRLMAVQGNYQIAIEKEIKCFSAGNIVLISNADPASISNDVDDAVKEILTSTDRDALRRQFLSRPQTESDIGDHCEDPLVLISSTKPDLLVSRTDKVFDRQSKRITSRFRMGVEATNQISNQILGLVQSSAPFVQSRIDPPQLQHTPNLLFCADDEAGVELENKANGYLNPGITFQRVKSPMDHFIFFYQEFPGFGISDLEISALSSVHLENAEKIPANSDHAKEFVTRYTHKIGVKMFDIKAIKEYEQAKLWINAMLSLAPEKFTMIGGQQCLSYQTINGITLPLRIDSADEVRGYVASNGFSAMERLFCKMLKDIGKPIIVERVNAMISKADTAPEKIAIGTKCDPILQAAFN